MKLIEIRPVTPMTRIGRPYVAIDSDTKAVIASHFCSHDDFAKEDLGEIDHGFGIKRREEYLKLYPEGFTIVFNNTLYLGSE